MAALPRFALCPLPARLYIRSTRRWKRFAADIMADLKIIVGNKNYSSWSLRGWLAVEMTGLAFEEEVIPLDRPETAAALQAASPSARVPVLRHGATVIWESLAICEYAAERVPDRALWPRPAAARAVARAVSAEMHAGFADLRRDMPMDMRAHRPGEGRSPSALRDVARIVRLWTECRETYGADGPYLFGDFSLADCMFAPVASRFVTYGVDLSGPAACYRDAVMDWPAVRAWRAAAEAEPWVID
jgi:glutathione S-transferase